MLFKLFVVIINELIIISRWKWWSSITRSSYCIKQHTTCIYIYIYIYISLYIHIYFYIYIYIYALNLFVEHSGEHWWEWNIFCLLTTPQAFWQSSALGALGTLVTSVVLYSLTRATLTSLGKDETRVCGYTLWLYLFSTLENTDENGIFFVRLLHHKHFGKAQHLVLWALLWHQLFSTR